MTETNETTGGEALVRALLAHKAGPIFGMGGFQLLPFYDAARRLGLNHHLINDERCGTFAADAYAKVSGRVGLVDATLGPGATNLVTGLVASLNAGSPIVAIVGDTHRDHSWKNMTQETHQAEILRPACKEVIRVESVQRIPELLRRAFIVATSGRPGPVVLIVPEDVAHGTFGFEDEDFLCDTRYEAARPLRCRPETEALAEAAALLATAERPLILAGGGVHISQAAEELQAFAEAMQIPVAHTMSGKGAIACTSPLSAGLFGRYDRIANDLATNPPTADEINRVTGPLGQRIRRASTGNQFWLYNLEGASFDPKRVQLLRSLLTDFSQTNPQIMQFLADRYFAQSTPLKLAIIPEGQELATAPPPGASSRGVLGR